MPNPASNSGIRDNHFCGSVADFLRPRLAEGARLSVVSAYFTIYACDALKEHLGQIEHMDFLFGDPTSSDPQWLTCDFAPVKTLARCFVGHNQSGRAFSNARFGSSAAPRCHAGDT
jgi:hypothetical protein